MEKTKVGIVSLGLIGGSILKGLWQKYEMFCYSTSSPENAFKYTKNISNNLDILKNCDIVFVCSPISKTLEILNKLNSIVNSNCVVCDCASVKGDLINQNFNYNFILSHPMAGKETSGFDEAEKDLFYKAKWLFEKENPLLLRLISDLGAIPLKIDMKEHDFMCAQISHLPTILACALFNCTENSSKKLASSGFRDMTRLASTNSTLSFDMLKYNKKNILLAFDNLIKEFDNLKKLNDSEKINLLQNIASKRARMYDDNGKNIL
ncbi:prephenate dehydrogenase [bacterium]|nr:prephenate dehydrogenase [bacterium]